MFFYRYFAKYHAELPIWDAFPLVVPFSIDSNAERIYGLNLHYIEPKFRFRLIQKMKYYRVTVNKRDYANVSYSLLKSLMRARVINEATKSYLLDHFRSRVVKIHPDDWETAASMDVADWRTE